MISWDNKAPFPVIRGGKVNFQNKRLFPLIIFYQRSGLALKSGYVETLWGSHIEMDKSPEKNHMALIMSLSLPIK